MKVILIHGNGGATASGLWFPYVKNRLEEKGFEVIAVDFPDSYLAREQYWMPFLESLHPDNQTILIGHSSGAILAMRYAEKYQVLGSVLVSAYHTDLGIEIETISGYFNRPWNWDAIKKNQQFIIQFNSSDDDLIPIDEARFVQKQLQTNYTEFNNRSHFFQNEFPELIEKVSEKLKAST